MIDAKVRIISKIEELPEIESYNIFHSVELFQILKNTPGHRPYMVVAEDANNHVVAHMLASIRRRGSLIPPYFFTQGRIFGEGEYEDATQKEELFQLMIDAITSKFKYKFCFYTEISDISKKMFGYRDLRRNGYFPISWQEVHNSLLVAPGNQLSPKTKKRIDQAYNKNVVVKEVTSTEEVKAFYKMLNRFYKSKPRRFVPAEQFFQESNKSNNCKIFLAMHNDKVIGGCLCAYSGEDAFLWYLASKRKSYKHLRPDYITVWHAIKKSYESGYRQISFLDVGLPYNKNRYREFILGFGGEPVSKFRWFRFSLPWLNKLISWFVR